MNIPASNRTRSSRLIVDGVFPSLRDGPFQDRKRFERRFGPNHHLLAAGHPDGQDLVAFEDRFENLLQRALPEELTSERPWRDPWTDPSLYSLD